MALGPDSRGRPVPPNVPAGRLRGVLLREAGRGAGGDAAALRVPRLAAEARSGGSWATRGARRRADHHRGARDEVAARPRAHLHDAAPEARARSLPGLPTAR